MYSIPFISITFTFDAHVNLLFQNDPVTSPLKSLEWLSISRIEKAEALTKGYKPVSSGILFLLLLISYYSPLCSL